ncbi:UNVERIFIED_CONTAM: ACT domain-containing protein, partial [Salmonella enterica subsp. enterica serovar Weltevreden]
LTQDARYAVPALAFQPDAVKPLPIVPESETESAYYLRLRVADEPGVLSKLTAILAAHDISVEAINQREPQDGEDAQVALITSVIKDQRLKTALAEMQTLPFVREGVARFRIEKFD